LRDVSIQPLGERSAPTEAGQVVYELDLRIRRQCLRVQAVQDGAIDQSELHRLLSSLAESCASALGRAQQTTSRPVLRVATEARK
jgi:hypothetical protein